MKFKKALTNLLLLFMGFSAFTQEINRVISLAPSITENIYLLDAQEKLVGCTSYCTFGINDGVEQVGSTINVNVEKILSLKPDVVLTMELTQPQDVAAMEKLGIQVEVMKTPKNFEEICIQTREIAKLIGKNTKADKVIAASKERVQNIRQKSKKIAPFKFFFQIGANPVFTVLEGTYMNDFITFCNGENIAAGLKHGTLTRESILLKNPDVIVIAEMGGFGEEEKKIWESFQGISAVKNSRIIMVPSETSCSPTPTNFAAAIEDIFKGLNFTKSE